MNIVSVSTGWGQHPAIALLYTHLETHGGIGKYHYQVQWLEELSSLSEPAITKRLTEIHEHPSLLDDIEVIIDRTHLGDAVVQALRDRDMSVYSVSLRQGSGSERQFADQVAWRDVMTVLQMLFDSNRMTISGRLKLEPYLSEQLSRVREQDYEVETSFAERNLMTAVAMAGWWADLTVGKEIEIGEEKHTWSFDPMHYGLKER
jgi:hypothetical protein